jgi:hypothetical protein
VCVWVCVCVRKDAEDADAADAVDVADGVPGGVEPTAKLLVNRGDCAGLVVEALLRLLPEKAVNVA